MTQNKALEILKSGKNVFLTGEPGSGKTHTINQFTEYLRDKGVNYAVTASTGIAATHINGVTIHSWSGIGIKNNLTDGEVQKIIGNKWVFDKIMDTKVLIIDEISMLNARFLNDLDKVLRAARNVMTDDPFGGIQLICVGDFYQLPPVSRQEEVRFAFESKSWKAANFTICYLTEQHRQNDTAFLEVLSAIRQLRVTDKHKQILMSNVPTQTPVTELFTHNVDVDRMNVIELQKLPDKEHKFIMSAHGIQFLIDTLKKHCLSPEMLILKVGAVVMFTKNKFTKGGDMVYVNGTIGKITEFINHLPVVETLDGETIYVESAEWKIEEKGQEKAVIRQLPLRLAWAVTVHKSQGMSLDAAKIDLSRAFEYGQGYVALSRVRSLAGLTLVGFNDRTFEMHPKVIEQDNVFRELSESNI